MKNIVAIMCLVVSVMFALLSFFTPPTGEIDNTILIYCGQLLLLVPAMLGIDVQSWTNFIKHK